MTATLRSYATFCSNLPDDQKEDGRKILAPGGRNIMERLRDSLTRRGFSTTEIKQHEDYGWCFDVVAADYRVWCLIQFCEPWLLITRQQGGLLKRLLGAGNDSTHRSVCKALQDILNEGSFFSGMRWFTRAEFEGLKRQAGHDKSVEENAEPLT